jgi:hypothetical protein
VRVLACWLGYADLKAAAGGEGLGPIGQAAKWGRFDEVALLSDHRKKPTADYCQWLKKQCDSDLKVYGESLSSPTHFGEIYEAAVRTVSDIIQRHGQRILWIPWIINKAKKDSRVTWWEERRGSSIDILLWLEAEDYLVVLARRSDYLLLKTAYCTEKPHKQKTLRKSRAKFQELKKD